MLLNFSTTVPKLVYLLYRVEPAYKDICLCGTSNIAKDVLWYEIIPHTSP